MSEDMIGARDTDALAAEYVLGTLDSEEHTAAQSLLAQDAEFAAKVKVWERRLGELHLMVEPVEPEGDIWQRIKAKLPEAPPVAVIALPEIEPVREPELKPEPEPELRPDPELKPASERKPEPEPESEPKSAPAAIAVESVPVSRDAPPATPGATALPPWPAAPVQAQVAAPADATVKPAPSATVKPSVGATGAPAPPFAAVPTARPALGVERDEKLRVIRRHLVRWRAVAVLMTVAVFAVASLLALWKYEPGRVPPVLRPIELMRLVGITIDTSPTLRKPAPPESQFDE
jgi:hypothetical protein